MSLLDDYNRHICLYGEYCIDQDKLRLTFPTADDYVQYKKQEYAKRVKPLVKSLTDGELLEKTLGIAGGDDYDGCFTDYGEVIYDELYSELAFRFLGPKEE